MNTSRIVTLTTDFGTRDGYVGAMKGRILSEAPAACIVDITHDIDAQDVRTGAWAIRRCFARYPADSIHVVVVDPGVGSDRSAILVHHAEQWLLGPDNGVLSLCWHGGKPDAVYRLHRETPWWRAHQSFDGLSLFAPAAACLVNRVALGDMAVRQIQYQQIELPEARHASGTLIGEIVQFDRFGNAITNIRVEDLRPFASIPFNIQCARRNYAMADCYSDSEPGAPIAIVNSDDLLELSCARGSAREHFGLRVGELVLLQPLQTGNGVP